MSQYNSPTTLVDYRRSEGRRAIGDILFSAKFAVVDGYTDLNVNEIYN
jgi:hypothetical protein